jgi:hypothetical protein
VPAVDDPEAWIVAPRRTAMIVRMSIAAVVLVALAGTVYAVCPLCP